MSSAKDQFWNWFAANQHAYLFLRDAEPEETKRLIEAFTEQLHAYCNRLFFLIGGRGDKGIQELIITADGDTDYFPQVEALVAAAPPIEGWKIIAFKPPMGRGFSTHYRGREYDPEKIIFIPMNNEDDPSAVGLQICFPDYDPEQRASFITGTCLAIDALLGEKSSALDIEYLDVTQTPEDIASYDFRHLSSLGEFIAERKGR